MIKVCPKCFEPVGDGPSHVCRGQTSKSSPTLVSSATAKQASITRQSANRRRYTHDGLELTSTQVTVTFDIDYVNDFDVSWLQEFLNVRLEIPEGPEDYPTVEDFYIRKAVIKDA